MGLHKTEEYQYIINLLDAGKTLKTEFDDAKSLKTIKDRVVTWMYKNNYHLKTKVSVEDGKHVLRIQKSGITNLLKDLFTEDTVKI